MEAGREAAETRKLPEERRDMIEANEAAEQLQRDVIGSVKVAEELQKDGIERKELAEEEKQWGGMGYQGTAEGEKRRDESNRVVEEVSTIVLNRSVGEESDGVVEEVRARQESSESGEKLFERMETEEAVAKDEKVRMEAYEAAEGRGRIETNEAMEEERERFKSQELVEEDEKERMDTCLVVEEERGRTGIREIERERIQSDEPVEESGRIHSEELLGEEEEERMGTDEMVGRGRTEIIKMKRGRMESNDPVDEESARVESKVLMEKEEKERVETDEVVGEKRVRTAGGRSRTESKVEGRGRMGTDEAVKEESRGKFESYEVLEEYGTRVESGVVVEVEEKGGTDAEFEPLEEPSGFPLTPASRLTLPSMEPPPFQTEVAVEEEEQEALEKVVVEEEEDTGKEMGMGELSGKENQIELKIEQQEEEEGLPPGFVFLPPPHSEEPLPSPIKVAVKEVALEGDEKMKAEEAEDEGLPPGYKLPPPLAAVPRLAAKSLLPPHAPVSQQLQLPAPGTPLPRPLPPPAAPTYGQSPSSNFWFSQKLLSGNKIWKTVALKIFLQQLQHFN